VIAFKVPEPPKVFRAGCVPGNSDERFFCGVNYRFWNYYNPDVYGRKISEQIQKLTIFGYYIKPLKSTYHDLQT